MAVNSRTGEAKFSNKKLRLLYMLLGLGIVVVIVGIILFFVA